MKKKKRKMNYNIEENSSTLKNIDDVYNETLLNNAKAAALVGPLGGMIGGPLGGINNLAAINSLAAYAKEGLENEDK